jgi:hypothetical protein
MPSTLLPEVVVPQMRLGRHVQHDIRSRSYRYRAVPKTLQSVTHLPSIDCLDQGDLGSCVANTGTELLATAAFNPVRPAVLDEAYAVDLYRELTRNDPFPGSWEPTDTGSDGTTLGKVLTSRGLASGYQHAMDAASFLDALQTRAVPIGITWRGGCDNPNSDGLIRWTGSIRGGHELLAVGYDADRQWVLIQNHWGSLWGIGGRCWMPVADLTAALADDGDATIILPATAPAPVPEVNADVMLARAFRAWRPSILSRVTKAGQLAKAGDAWLAAKGY